MASGRPLFAGSAVDEQLHLIVKLLGTPTELTWPGVSQLHEFMAYEFPRYKPEPLVKHVPRWVDSESYTVSQQYSAVDSGWI